MAQKIKHTEYLFDLPKIEDARGNLSFLEEGGDVPFSIARIYWIYDVPGGRKRGSHAFKTQHEIIIALSGSFDIVLNDGKEERRYTLNRSYKALYVPPLMWRHIDNFSTNSVCLVISSGSYDPDEYIRNFKQFKQYLKNDIPNPAIIPQPHQSVIIPADIQYSSVEDCNTISLPVIQHNRAGSLTPIHNSVDIPFDVKRIFFVYDIPYGKKRGIHAHRHCHQFIIAASGSFDIEIDDGNKKKKVNMNRPTEGIHILPGIWSKEFNYSSGAICLVLASERYTEEDYIRKYSDYKQLYGNKTSNL